jgi:hypothetical protein
MSRKRLNAFVSVVVVAAFIGAYGYFRIERNLWLAIGAAAVMAALCARLLLRDTEGRGEEQAPEAPPRFGLEVIVGGVGIGLLLAGAVDGSSALVLAGLPLAALGGTWWLIKRDVRGRGSGGEG